MKVLISTESIDCGQNGNPFVRDLAGALVKSGHEVFGGHDRLLKGAIEYDFVLLQWPEEIFDYNAIDQNQVLLLERRLKEFKAAGCIIGYTRHNLLPHYNNDPGLKMLYNVVETNVDIVFNMGSFSRDQFSASGVNNKAMNVIVPHHLPNLDFQSIDRATARRQLRLNEKDKIVLSFGGFRANEERDMVIGAFKRLQMKNKRLLVPRLFNGKLISRDIVGSIRRFCDRLKYMRFGGLSANSVSSQLVPYYFSAADVVMIQRKHILNSGNVPLAFGFGKVVVGPDKGNVGTILRETGNPVFDPDDMNSVVAALSEGIKLAENAVGDDNRTYAMGNWTVDKCVHTMMHYVNTYKCKG